MMNEKAAKKPRKGSISEHDIAAILEKYSATTILAMLSEIAQIAESNRIDWSALVDKTSTGISSTREYQMLWRHLAYRDDLSENLDDDAQPLDDDSDLEYELEAFPSVSGEASAEAAACVKVLIASGNDSIPNGSTIEAPLTVNIPNSLSSDDIDQPSCSMQGTNITVPVSVQRQPAPPAPVAEGTAVNGSNGANCNKRKRKPWSEAEDLELIAAVQKCGEGNWANILRGDFKGDRTASQLSQRWAIIRKRNGGNLNLGNGGQSNDSQLTESQIATRHAIMAALNDKPTALTSNYSISNGFTTTTANRPAGTSSIPNPVKPSMTNNSSVAAETSINGSNNIPQPQKPPQETAMPKPSVPIAKSQSLPPVKKQVIKSTPNSSDDRVRATAVIAGARIASPSDAASLIKAAQGKNTIHIGGSVKPAAPGGVSEANPNVHFIRTGLANTPKPNYAPAKPVAPVTKHLPAVSRVKTAGEAKAPELGSASKEEIRVNGTHVTSPVPDANTNLKTGEKDQQVIAGVEPKKAADIASTNGRQAPQQIEKMEEDLPSVVNSTMKKSVNQNSNKEADLPSIATAVVKNGEKDQKVHKMVAIPASTVENGEKKGDGAIDKMEIDKMEIDRC